MHRFLLIGLACVLAMIHAPDVALAQHASGSGWVWIEGQDAAEHDFIRHGWYDDVDKAIMSGRDWLSHYGDRPGTASYRFTSPGQGEYILWMRLNPFRVSKNYRLDDTPWRAIEVDDRHDQIMISPQPDHRFLAWVRVGQVELGEAEHELALRIDSDLANHGGIDAIVLTQNEDFIPTGTRQPGAEHEAGPEVWFPVLPRDEFEGASVIDLSHLNHDQAGERGRLIRDGNELRFESDEEPTRLWGVNGNIDPDMTQAQMTRRARYFARHGVNAVRHHPVFDFLGPLRDGEFDAERLDQFDRWFATLKAHGIYHHWSIFYPLVICEDDGYPPQLFAELNNGRTYGLVNISRTLQDMQLAYVSTLLEHVNPYTGLAYHEDPALAVVEIHNEDSIFFHSPLNQLAQGDDGEWPEHARLLRRSFRDWAFDRYDGSTQALQQAWGTPDTFDDQQFDIYAAWQMDGDGPRVGGRIDESQRPRMGDFIRFLTEMQRGFYERRVAELRGIGYEGLIITTAWRAGGAAADPANLYADTAGDAISRHNYVAGHEGSHRVEPGLVGTFTHMDRPGAGLLSMGLYQVEAMPFGTTEWSQTTPNPYKSEAAPLIAFYGMGLQGWDFSYKFTSAASATRLGDGWPGLRWYAADTPHYMGQFPALALAVRRGDIAPAGPAAARRLQHEDLFTGLDPLEQNLTGGGWDDKRLVGQAQTPAEVLAIGRVSVGFDGGESDNIDWDQHWYVEDGQLRAVQSTTGELRWDAAGRVVTVASDRTQAVIGFAGESDEAFELPAVELEIDTPFVSLILTSLDAQPLESSRSILVTAMARDKQTGTVYSDDMSRLEQLGGPPLLMEPVQATLRLRGQAIERVQPLDVHGVPTGEQVQVRDNTFDIDGRWATYYYHVTR